MPARSQRVPVYWEGGAEEHLRKVANAVNALQKGQSNNGFEVTLRANQTTTDLTIEFARPGNIAQIAPQSASAALAASKVWTTVSTGKVTLNHDSDPATDRKFGVVIVA